MFKTLLPSLLGLLWVIGGFAQTLTPVNQPLSTGTDLPNLGISNPIAGAVYQQGANGQAKLVINGSVRSPRTTQYSGIANVRPVCKNLIFNLGLR